MWEQSPTDTFRKALRKWPKKHKRELGAMLANLETVLAALQKGAKIEHIDFGFIHREPAGVLAIDQKGGGAGLKQTRLYVYPHKPNSTLYLITIGDKKSQEDDIAYARAFVEGVRGADEANE